MFIILEREDPLPARNSNVVDYFYFIWHCPLNITFDYGFINFTAMSYAACVYIIFALFDGYIIKESFATGTMPTTPEMRSPHFWWNSDSDSRV